MMSSMTTRPATGSLADAEFASPAWASRHISNQVDPKQIKVIRFQMWTHPNMFDLL
jgi:hypothetical protein